MTTEPKRKAGIMGRPALQPGKAKRVLVTLDDETIERGQALGDGNLSKGIREALNPRPAAAPAARPSKGASRPGSA